ncbi:TonB-dependent receptor plug domain-containing protein [Flavobacteriaceae bacterium TP-CH-4]|uniref:TonB-dependent receptor plug domain-containing protein n=1 Tax=Pelagihabitans pacificus TaxID=2696054 RepID=A0A967ASC7_9FLAO|nr:TonB-dependent receptor plug domain-containing protein [Pelagihabitans pacificus]NHF59393.1 TonB-dependent receptor plug domain-containing protein [Pelagihabitans pacificus]
MRKIVPALGTPKIRVLILAIGIVIALGFDQVNQNNPILERILGKLAIYASTNSPEKIYIHTDKDIYTDGETIWFNTYLIDGIFHGPSDKSEVVYVELLNETDSLVAFRKLRIDRMTAPADFPLPIGLKEGNYLLRAYTKYMLNEQDPTVFQKVIPIYRQEVDALHDLSTFNSNAKATSAPLYDRSTENRNPKQVQLYPEGGDLVAGLSSVLGIEALDKNGEGLAVSGTIVNDSGKPMAFFNTHESGLGKVSFTPKPNEKYYAQVIVNDAEKNFLVPRALPSGFVMSIRNNGDHLVLNISTNIAHGLEGSFVIGHFRGDTFFKRQGTSEDADSYTVKLKTDRLMDGVAHFTLFSKEGQPICERLVFVDHPDNDKRLLVAQNAEKYGTRQKAGVAIKVTDSDGTLYKGDFSMSVVTKSNQLPKNMAKSDIKSWLLLDSDLGGTVKDPSYFFEDVSSERKFLLDALMLTHGWRRFAWKDLAQEQVNRKPTYSPEKAEGITLSGYTALNKNPDVRKQATVALRIPERGISETQITDARGRFSFGPYPLENGEKTYLEVVESPKKRRSNHGTIAIFLDKNRPEVPVTRVEKIRFSQSKLNPEIIKKGVDPNSKQSDISTYLRQSYTKKVADFQYDPTVTQLDEVAVSAQKKDVYDKVDTPLLVTNPNVRLFPDSLDTGIPVTAMDIIARAPGITVSGIPPNQTLKIKTFSGHGNSGGILYLVNNSEVPLEFIQTMDPSDILFVDVLRGVEAAAYGSRASKGAVVITTRSRKSDEKPRLDYDKDPNLIIPNFYKEREFYTPTYSTESQKAAVKHDYRTTLLWRPNITIEDSGSTLVNFFTGDTRGDFVIKVEGITRDGSAVVGYSEFTVE